MTAKQWKLDADKRTKGTLTVSYMKSGQEQLGSHPNNRAKTSLQVLKTVHHYYCTARITLGSEELEIWKENCV